MKTHIAFLRGINVGGKNRLPMRELVELLHTLGLDNISTYIQSGNVVFQSQKGDQAGLAQRIQAAIHEGHGFTPPIVLLGLKELERAVSSNPFPGVESDHKALHLFFLASKPENPDLKMLSRLKRSSESFEHRGKVFYLHAPEGIGGSKLAARVERSLGVTATARNWRSVCNVLEIARQLR